MRNKAFAFARSYDMSMCIRGEGKGKEKGEIWARGEEAGEWAVKSAGKRLMPLRNVSRAVFIHVDGKG
jgi:hypothetical protein